MVNTVGLGRSRPVSQWRAAGQFSPTRIPGILNGAAVSGLGKINEPQGAIRRWQGLASSLPQFVCCSSPLRDRRDYPPSRSSSKPPGHTQFQRCPVSWDSEVPQGWRCHQGELVALRGKDSSLEKKAVASNRKRAKSWRRGREAQE